MNKLPIEYIAGVIDARGHISINGRHGKNQPKIAVTTKRLTLIDFLGSVTGVGITIDNKEYERKPCLAHCTTTHSHTQRQSSYWTVGSSRATIVLYNIKPLILAQPDEVNYALRIGLESFNPRGDTVKSMREFGWKIPRPI